MKYEEYTSAWDKDRSAAEIEADLYEIRSEMSRTLEELEARMSPRAVAERAAARSRRAPVRKAGELARKTREHPGRAALVAVPLLVGAFIGWRAWTRGRRRSQS